jgi:hypothetical protein
MKVYIYTLEHPVTKEVRYIGKTKNPKERFHNHCNRLHNQYSHKRNWINSLRNQGLKPVMNILDEIEESEWKYWEKFWIEQFRQWGFDLVNHTSGGDGLTVGNQTSFKKGQKPWNYGKAKPKILKGNVGKTENSIKNQFKPGFIPWNKGSKGYSTSKKGQFLSQTTKIKISNSLKGKESNKKRIIKQYNKNMELVKEYPSITEAVLKTGIKSISNALTGRAKTAGGYIWL